MAIRASWGFSNSTIPQPLDLPVSLSCAIGHQQTSHSAPCAVWQVHQYRIVGQSQQPHRSHHARCALAAHQYDLAVRRTERLEVVLQPEMCTRVLLMSRNRHPTRPHCHSKAGRLWQHLESAPLGVKRQVVDEEAAARASRATRAARPHHGRPHHRGHAAHHRRHAAHATHGAPLRTILHVGSNNNQRAYQQR